MSDFDRSHDIDGWSWSHIFMNDSLTICPNVMMMILTWAWLESIVSLLKWYTAQHTSLLTRSWEHRNGQRLIIINADFCLTCCLVRNYCPLCLHIVTWLYNFLSIWCQGWSWDCDEWDLAGGWWLWTMAALFINLILLQSARHAVLQYTRKYWTIFLHRNGIDLSQSTGATWLSIGNKY